MEKMTKVLKYCLALTLIFIPSASFVGSTSALLARTNTIKQAPKLSKSEIKMSLAISQLSPNMPKEKANKIAQLISKHSKNFEIDGKIMLAIIQVESSFRQEAVSSTGDFSIAQINYEIWNQELKRMGRKPLDLIRLKQDHDYAIKRMAEILNILSNRYTHDPEWYARYHSRTPKLKNAYAKKVKKNLNQIQSSMIASAKNIENQK